MNINNYTSSQNNGMNFKDMDERVIDFLESLIWPHINNRNLTYPTDYKRLITGFRHLVKNGIPYHPDEIHDWLYFHQPENHLEDKVIDEIVNISTYVLVDFQK